jgi:hypothetical protein
MPLTHTWLDVIIIFGAVSWFYCVRNLVTGIPPGVALDRWVLVVSLQGLVGLLLLGSGVLLYRRAKAREAPDVSWFRFVHSKLITVAILAVGGTIYWVLPEATKESIWRVLRWRP